MTPREQRLVAGGLVAWIAVVLAADSLPPSPASVMAGHMLLVLLAAPPLALGLRAAPLPPAAGVVLFSATVLVAAVPAVLALCTRSSEAHAVLDLVVVAGAVALFGPLRSADGPLPLPLLVAAMPACDLAGAWLMLGAGERAAGVVMLLGSAGLGLWGLALSWRWMLAEERRA